MQLSTALDTLPMCSTPKYRSDGPSTDVDKEVKSILRLALSIYNVDVGMIKLGSQFAPHIIE